MPSLQKLHLVVENKEEALAKYLNYILHVMKVGFVIILTGSPHMKIGTGKTVTAAGIGEEVEAYGAKHFGVKTRFTADKFTLTAGSFLDVIEKIETGVEERKEYGQVVVFDEAGLEISSNKWQNIKNEVVVDTIRTFRELRCIAIIISPTFADIDKRIRKLCAFWGYPEISMGSGGKKVCYLRLYQITTDTFGETVIPRSLKFYLKLEGRLAQVDKFTRKLPSKDVLEGIELKAHERKVAHRKQLREKIRIHEEGERAFKNSTKFDINESIATALKNPSIFKRLESGKRISGSLIMRLTKGDGSDEIEFPGINRSYAADIATGINETYGIEKKVRA